MRISNKKWHRVKLRNRRIYKKAKERHSARTSDFRSFRQFTKWRRNINRDIKLLAKEMFYRGEMLSKRPETETQDNDIPLRRSKRKYGCRRVVAQQSFGDFVKEMGD